MALNSAVTNIAALAAESINKGASSSGRQSLGGGGTAFGWASGLPPTVADYATKATSSGMTFPVTRVSTSGTPVAVVGAGAAKPNAATVASTTESLVKMAGYGRANLEDYLDADNLGQAIASVLGAGSLMAFEANAVAALDAATATPVTGATWVGAVAAAQAAILGQGGTPSAVVISAADYAAFVDDVLGTSAFSVSADSPVGALLGTPVHVSPKAAAGKAWAFDSAAVLCVQHERSPLVGVDVSGINNVITIVSDLVAGTYVTNSALLVEITAPVGTLGASHSAPTVGKRK